MLMTLRESKALKGLGTNWILILTMLILTACGQQAEEELIDFDASSDPQNLQELAVQTRFRTYDAIWETVNEHYVYANIADIDLGAVETEFRTRITGSTDHEAFQETIKEMFTFFPEGTVLWQTRDERIQREVNSSVGSNYEGIGSFIIFRTDIEPHVVLTTVMPGSPAEAAGLQERDSIYALDGQPFSADETAAEVAARVRGPSGSSVTLTVQSPGEERREVEVTRGPIQVTGRRIQARFNTDGKILTVVFPRIGYTAMAEDFVILFQGFSENSEIEGIIFDLRIATSGPDFPIDQLLSLFTEGEIGQSFSNSESLPVLIEPQSINNTQRLNIAVLIGPETQGVPELFAAGLQSTGRGVVYGLPSAANLEATLAFAMPDGSQLTVTTASFLTSQGIDIGISGVIPDVPINLYWETQPAENDAVVNAALNDLRELGN